MTALVFNYPFLKLPPILNDKSYTSVTQVIGIQVTNSLKLSKQFIEYDTKYSNGCHNGFYPLPEGKVIVITLLSFAEAYNGSILAPKVWTIVRKWTKKKEEELRNSIGKEITIILNTSY